MDLKEYKDGFKAGIPIALGYFAVAFSLGIAAKQAGMSPIEGFVASLITYASAGEYATIALIESGAGILESIFMSIVVNIRYLLMGAVLSSKIDPSEKKIHRLGMSAILTDEVFGICIARNKLLHGYPYGAWFIATLSWAIATAVGITAGNILPAVISDSLSLSLYGMFIAIIIPAGKKDKNIMLAIICSFILSFILNYLPVFNFLSSNAIIIILTLAISLAFAYFFPVGDKHE